MQTPPPPITLICVVSGVYSYSWKGTGAKSCIFYIHNFYFFIQDIFRDSKSQLDDILPAKQIPKGKKMPREVAILYKLS